MMMRGVKAVIAKIPGSRFALNAARNCWESMAFAVWTVRGRMPGDRFSFYKRHRLIREGRHFGCSTLVETGTFLGKTVEATRRHFQRVLSVELSTDLYRLAVKKFRYVPNVQLWHGDSSKVMKEMLSSITGRAIFWLDGHYSGGITAQGECDCPLISELAVIRRHERKDHLILIDDARCFGSDPAYPKQSEVRELLLSINPKYQITVEDDCIIARPA